MEFKVKVMKGKPVFGTKLQELCDDGYLHYCKLLCINNYLQYKIEVMA